MNTTRSMSLMLAVALSAAAGCQNSSKPQEVRAHGEVFDETVSHREVHSFNEAQYANGARDDATLRIVHFSGGTLNSLGRQKLDQMVSATDSEMPLVVYVDVPKDAPALPARKDCINMYLKDKGLTADQIVLKDGPNLDYSYPAAIGLRALAALDTSGSSSQAGGGSSASASTPSAH